jgi:hypothetical protein
MEIKIYKTMILPVICMGTTFGLSHTLIVLESRMLRGIFGPWGWG